MPNLINKLLYSEMESLLEGRESFLVVRLNGMKAEEAHALRGKLLDRGVDMKVIKNRIAALALSKLGHEEVNADLEGMCALVYGDEEGSAIAAAKAIEEEVKKAKREEERTVRVQAALLDGEVLGRERAARLHTMPDKNTLRSMLVGAIQGPMRGLATLLAAPGSSLARALKARAEGEGDGA